MIMSKYICPECESLDVEADLNKMVCNSCGLVFDPSQDNGSERSSSLDEWDFRSDKDIDIEKKLLLRSIRPSNATEQRVLRALLIIEELSERLELPAKVKIDAAEIYKEGMKRGLIHGRSIRAFAAASVYISCRLNGFTLTIDLLAKLSRESRKSLNSTVKLIIRELKISLRQKNLTDILYAIGYRIGLEENTIKRAEEIIHRAKSKINLAGKMKEGFAAAAIYIAAKAQGIRISQREIANACGITEVTLRTRKRELTQYFMNSNIFR